MDSGERRSQRVTRPAYGLTHAERELARMVALTGNEPPQTDRSTHGPSDCAGHYRYPK